MEYISQKEEKIIKNLIHNVQGLSFGSAQKMLRLGNIKVNDKRIKDNIDIHIGDKISIRVFNASMPKVDILYEDDNVLIVNKPQGIECATRDKSSDNTYSLEEIFAPHSPIVVHRLDRLTEGIVIMAKRVDIARKFEKYFETKKIEKHYMALVNGNVMNEGIETAYIYKDAKHSISLVSDTAKPEYKEIITEYHVKKKYTNTTLLEINLHTGRTHQIRAHMAHLGHPIYNDNKYAKSRITIDKNYKGYYLTAFKIIFHLDDDLKYLNDICLEITPTWLQYLQ